MTDSTLLGWTLDSVPCTATSTTLN